MYNKYHIIIIIVIKPLTYYILYPYIAQVHCTCIKDVFTLQGTVLIFFLPYCSFCVLYFKHNSYFTCNEMSINVHSFNVLVLL